MAYALWYSPAGDPEVDRIASDNDLSVILVELVQCGFENLTPSTTDQVAPAIGRPGTYIACFTSVYASGGRTEPDHIAIIEV
jgi:hypothetical protein